MPVNELTVLIKMQQIIFIMLFLSNENDRVIKRRTKVMYFKQRFLEVVIDTVSEDHCEYNCTPYL